MTQLSVSRWHEHNLGLHVRTKTHGEGIIVRGPQIGGRGAGCGPGAAY